MSDVKWIKLATDLFEDEKILLLDTEPDADALIVLWVKLLCLAGRQNRRGVFEMSNGVACTTEMLAMFFRRPVELVERALELFQRYGMVEIADGKVCIPNWEKHQNLDALEKKREYQRNLMRSRRNAQKAASCGDDSSPECEPNRDDNVSPLDKKRKEKNRKKSVSFEEFAAGDAELLEALEGFESMRKEIRKPLTERARQLLLTRLQQFPPGDWVPMLNVAVMNSWLNVYPMPEAEDRGQGPGTRRQGTGTRRQGIGSAASELENFYAMTAEWAEEKERE